MKRFLFFTLLCTAFFSLEAENLSPNGFIRDWLVSAPYPSYQKGEVGTGLNTDFLNGEKDVQPYPGLKGSAVFIADKSKLIAGANSTNEWGKTENMTLDTTWKVWHFKEDIIYFDEKAFPVEDFFAFYAVSYIDSQVDQEIRIKAGSDDDHKLYINGKLIGKVESSQGAEPRFKYNCRLHSGINTIVYKIIDRKGGAGFTLGLFDTAWKPLKNITVHTDHPGRKYGMELFSFGCGAAFKWDSKDLMMGRHTLKIALHNPKKYAVSLNGKNLSSTVIPMDLQEGNLTLTLEFTDNGKRIAKLCKTFQVFSEAKVKAENEKLRQDIASMKQTVKTLENQKKASEKSILRIKKALAEAYRFREECYKKMRAANQKGAAKSISEPLKQETKRSRLCLNGQWDFSPDGKTWTKALLPNWMLDYFYFAWFYPVKAVDPKNTYGKYKTLPGFPEGIATDRSYTSYKGIFRNHFNYDGQGSAVLTLEVLDGRAEVFCNGVSCGTAEGQRIAAFYELKGLKKGKNTLEIHYAYVPFSENIAFGLRDNIFLDFVPEIRVKDIYVKPSWRKASLETRTELVNRSNKPVDLEVRQYAVRDSRIRHKLPVRKLHLEPGKMQELRTVSKWADPLLWGPGGKYGNPDLYELVTDIYSGGKLVDRHVQKFGFREFWIFHTDFFLNGKRIFLQGDTGSHYDTKHAAEIRWDLLRKDNFNMIRMDLMGHDLYDEADRSGMMIHAQMYPVFNKGFRDPKQKQIPFEEWPKTKEHAQNLINYEAKFRMGRNHPCIFIWSIDNETFTQAWDSDENAAVNIRGDKIAAMYEKYMKKLDPDLVLTRDGDRGTMNSKQRWFEDPPCDTANYHYPDFDIKNWVMNWQAVYEYRPAHFGETLYYSYGAWDKWIGSIPSQVKAKAQRVRAVVKVYRDLEVPGAIYMGDQLDGFTQLDTTGKGNPWGIRSDYKTHGLPEDMRAGKFPFYRVDWPAYSGKGIRLPGYGIDLSNSMGANLNWFDERHPTHIRNAVNDAYRDTLLPQEPLRTGTDAECIIKTTPFADVWTILPNGERYGVRADQNGRAWFHLDHPGKYAFTNGTKSITGNLAPRGKNALKAGFSGIPEFELK